MCLACVVLPFHNIAYNAAIACFMFMCAITVIDLRSVDFTLIYYDEKKKIREFLHIPSRELTAR